MKKIIKDKDIEPCIVGLGFKLTLENKKNKLIVLEELSKFFDYIDYDNGVYNVKNYHSHFIQSVDSFTSQNIEFTKTMLKYGEIYVTEFLVPFEIRNYKLEI